MRFRLLLSLVLSGAVCITAGCSLNAAGIDSTAGDASTSDARPGNDSGPVLTGWCATAGAGHDFCAGFDTSLAGAEPGGWCSNVAASACGSTESDGMLTLDLVTSKVPPSSVSAQTMASGASSRAFLRREFPGDLHPLNLAFDVQLDAVGTGRAAIAGITLEDMGGNPHRVSLFALPPGDAGPDARLVIVEKPLGGGPNTTLISVTLPLSKFVRVELRIGIAPNNVTVTVDGKASSSVTIDAPGSAIGRAVQLGLDCMPADAWQLHVDDVTFDFTK